MIPVEGFVEINLRHPLGIQLKSEDFGLGWEGPEEFPFRTIDQFMDGLLGLLSHFILLHNFPLFSYEIFLSLIGKVEGDNLLLSDRFFSLFHGLLFFQERLQAIGYLLPKEIDHDQGRPDEDQDEKNLPCQTLFSTFFLALFLRPFDHGATYFFLSISSPTMGNRYRSP